jgi:hypothetical protein
MIGAANGELLMSSAWLDSNSTMTRGSAPVLIYIPPFEPFDALHCEILPERLLEYTWYLFSAGLLFCCGLAACQVWRSLVFCRRWQRRRNGRDGDVENPLRRGLLSRIGIRDRQAAIAALPTRTFTLAALVPLSGSAEEGAAADAAADAAAADAEAGEAGDAEVSDAESGSAAVEAVADATADAVEMRDVATSAAADDRGECVEGDSDSSDIETLDFFTTAATTPASAAQSAQACAACLPSNPATAHIASTQLECVICIEEFVEGETLRVLPCNHCFHVACVDVWLLERPLCPLCKAAALPAAVSESTNLL